MSKSESLFLRLSSEDYERLYNYALRVKKDPQGVLRDYIKTLDSDVNQIKNDIIFHEFQIQQLQHKLVEIGEPCESNEAPVAPITVKKDDSGLKILSKYRKLILQPIMQANEGKEFADDDEKDTFRKDVLGAVRSTITSMVHENHRARVYIDIAGFICRNLLNYDRHEYEYYMREVESDSTSL